MKYNSSGHDLYHAVSSSNHAVENSNNHYNIFDSQNNNNHSHNNNNNHPSTNNNQNTTTYSPLDATHAAQFTPRMRLKLQKNLDNFENSAKNIKHNLQHTSNNSILPNNHKYNNLGLRTPQVLRSKNYDAYQSSIGVSSKRQYIPSSKNQNNKSHKNFRSNNVNNNDFDTLSSRNVGSFGSIGLPSNYDSKSLGGYISKNTGSKLQGRINQNHHNRSNNRSGHHQSTEYLNHNQSSGKSAPILGMSNNKNPKSIDRRMRELERRKMEAHIAAKRREKFFNESDARERLTRRDTYKEKNGKFSFGNLSNLFSKSMGSINILGNSAPTNKTSHIHNILTNSIGERTTQNQLFSATSTPKINDIHNNNNNSNNSRIDHAYSTGNLLSPNIISKKSQGTNYTTSNSCANLRSNSSVDPNHQNDLHNHNHKNKNNQSKSCSSNSGLNIKKLPKMCRKIAKLKKCFHIFGSTNVNNHKKNHNLHGLRLPSHLEETHGVLDEIDQEINSSHYNGVEVSNSKNVNLNRKEKYQTLQVRQCTSNAITYAQNNNNQNSNNQISPKTIGSSFNLLHEKLEKSMDDLRLIHMTGSVSAAAAAAAQQNMRASKTEQISRKFPNNHSTTHSTNPVNRRKLSKMASNELNTTMSDHENALEDCRSMQSMNSKKNANRNKNKMIGKQTYKLNDVNKTGTSQRKREREYQANPQSFREKEREKEKTERNTNTQVTDNPTSSDNCGNNDDHDGPSGLPDCEPTDLSTVQSRESNLLVRERRSTTRERRENHSRRSNDSSDRDVRIHGSDNDNHNDDRSRIDDNEAQPGGVSSGYSTDDWDEAL